MTPPPGRILVVDDNEALRENLAEALQLEGYDVAVASDGQGALAHLGHDAAFAADPREQLAAVHPRHREVEEDRGDPRLASLPVVLTTGHTGARARDGVPADAFLTKPFGVRELLAALRKVGA